MLPPLPIDPVLPGLVRALSERRAAVLRAPTGAGKTTRVPPALLDAGIAGDKQVVVLEPRRLAARAAARRISQERGTELGREIGWHVRFDRRASRATRILVVTEGLLVRRFQEDPFLEDVGAIVFDEIHERSLDTDLSLAMARKLQREARPELALLAMSATLVPERLVAFLGDAPLIESEGRLHPVEIAYLPGDARIPLQKQTAAAIARALESTGGDVLAFLPGVGEIRRTRDEVADMCRRRGVDVHELYGDLPAEQQDAVLRRQERRKVVLSTNVAQTSVTIEGVTAVVDSGLARTLRFDPSVALDRLVLERISRASADQRAGRAGRTQPGICLRLWSEGEQRSLAAEDEPEIRRVDLAGAALELHAWGEKDLGAFGWLEKPGAAALARADELLRRLGALDESGVTSVGRRMASLPVHPRLARLLIECERLGCAGRGALAAALLSERDPFVRARGRRTAKHVSDSDLLDRVQALEEFEDARSTSSEVGELDPGGARRVLEVRNQLARTIPGRDEPGSARSLARAVLAAYPDRLARRREAGSRRGVLAGGRGVVLADDSAVDGELFVALDLDAGARGERADALVRIASGVERGDLDPERLVSDVAVAFDEAKERVVATRRLRFDDLAIEESQAALPESAEVERVLGEAASRDLARVMPEDRREMDAFLARVRCLREWMPELGLPELGEAELRRVATDLCPGRRSFDELRRAPWLEFLRGRLTWTQLQALDREAPERWTLPSGRSARLAYEPGRPPVLASRIQDFFGVAETPRVAGGRVGVLLHLLGPNQRPQQITDDLASFWSTTYPRIRGELKRRYPKHAWPEDPR